jgi:aryl-alcohol dehydrogenase-like predicted oxidoreductase
VVDVLEELVAAGKVRWYGSSVSDPAIVRAMAEGPHMVASEHELNVLRGELETLGVAEELGLACLNRTPLAMGLLSGRYRPDALPAADDVRRNAPWWDFFDEGAMERWLQRIAEVRAELTADGRSLVQGALGWIWGRSALTLPLPGFRTVAQVQENAGAAEHGPLPTEQMERIRAILGEPLPA